ncbi:MAG: DUF3450 domain-containing protein [Deltaproteobacteria bacterium]|nr:DUF3450 domain-containing protein [Deltaproteobacteria bacterium]MBW2444362.1 DUF3450 domain-containing protein [Deltaproteobacteria bacterium]
MSSPVETPPTLVRRRLSARARAIAAGLVGLLLAFAAPLASAQSLDRAVAVREKANRTGAQSQGRIDQIADETDDLLGKYRIELQQIDALRSYNTQLEKLLASQEAEIESLGKEIGGVTVIGRQVTPLMLRMVDALSQFVDLDVPFLPEERATRVSELKKLMDRSDVADAEKYRRTLEAYQIENEYGRTIETYRGNLEVGGESRTVDFLRIGRVALLYQTLDANEVGTWDQAERSWKTLDGSYNEAVRRGLRIARKQAAPDLLRLPIKPAEDAR